MTDETWPSLPLPAWQDTYATLHMWTQIVGKTRLALSPMVNHWWNVTFYLTPRGLTTSAMPYGDRTFSVDFDFLDHLLVVRSSDGQRGTLPLAPRSVADFYQEYRALLHGFGLEVKILTRPVEVDPSIPFAEDHEHSSYDPVYANRFWRILSQADRVMQQFRGRFLGKCSPVHFFWGACDLAVTRFSGRGAPRHPGGAPNCADWVMWEAYSHEVSSCGFWAGGGPGHGAVVLRLRVPRAPGLRRVQDPAARGLLSPGYAGVPPALRSGPHHREARRGAARFSAEHLRGRGGNGRMGSSRAGALGPRHPEGALIAITSRSRHKIGRLPRRSRPLQPSGYALATGFSCL